MCVCVCVCVCVIVWFWGCCYCFKDDCDGGDKTRERSTDTAPALAQALRKECTHVESGLDYHN